MHRRNLLIGAALGAVASGVLPKSAVASPQGVGMDDPVIFPEGQPVPTVDEILASMPRFQGTRPAYEEEVAKAKVIVTGCVSGGSPIEVAQYFEQLRNGVFDDHFGDDSSLYAQEWPVRANPVIVGFFDATTLRTPAGDQTAWCAAFVNWCIARATGGGSAMVGTKNAASASFRSWKSATDTPQPGDLVVFKHKQKPAQGHVAFFVSKTSTGVYVLGGNQMPLRRLLPNGTYDAKNTGEVNTKFFPFNGKDLELHSFRTDPVLHSRVS